MSQAKKVPKDTYLFREGDPPDAMFIVKSGQLAITKTKGSSEIVLAEVGPGAMVGEMAVFDKKPRSANVKALKDAEVVALPYDALDKQIEALPNWLKAIMRTMNENLREANKKIKTLEQAGGETDRFAPHIVNKYLTILNLIGHKFGQKEGDGVSIPSNRLRNYTIQVFQEATNKMETVQMALQALGMFTIEDLGDGKKKLVNLQPDFLFGFVDWYNDWLFKADKDKISISQEEIKILNGVLHFAKKVEPNAKGVRKVNVADIQNDSMRDLGFLIKTEELAPLIEKKLVSEKIMEEAGVFVNVITEEIEKPTMYWKFIWDLKKHLR